MKKILVGMGTCGLSAGARDTYEKLKELTSANANDAELTITGCIGMCYREPLVEIRDNGQRTIYGDVNSERATEIFNSHVINEKVLDDFVAYSIDSDGTVGGIEFLIEKAENTQSISGTIVVVGGGNTAMDCERTSWRLNADKVIILYRRNKAEMPADKLEIEDCIKEGIEIMELAAPIGIVKDGDKLKALKCIRMKLGEPDASGRRRPVPQEGSEFELPCDIAIAAIGQGIVLDGIAEASPKSPSVSKWNTIEIDTKTMKTNIDGVFAGGDAADDGPTVAIDAIRDGKIAASSIHAFLSNEKIKPEPFVANKEFWAKPGQAELGDVKESPRHPIHEIEVDERRNNFKKVATGYEYEDAVHECDRCLSCGCI